MGRGLTIVELDADRVMLVSVEVSGARVEVKAVLERARPREVDPTHAKAKGEWLAGLMDEIDAPANVVVVLPRRDVVLKRIGLPQGIGPREVGGVVRLQMVKQLAVNAESAAIDHVPARAEATGVLAGALPGERLEFLKRVCDSAGMKLKGVTLRCFGAARAAAGTSTVLEGLAMVIHLGAGSSEFTLVDRGEVVFSRTAHLTRGEGSVDEVAAKVAVEAKRTWMSYRLSSEGVALAGVVVLGNDDLGRRACERAAEALDVGGEVVDPGLLAHWPSSTPSEQGGAVLAAAALALLDREELLDFASPRKAPDVSAPRRQMALAAAFGLIVVVGAAGLFVSRAVGDMQARVSAAKTHRDELAGQYSRLLVEKARLNHLRAWQASNPDWLGHLQWVSDHVPATDQALISSIDASLEESEVQFTGADSGDVVTGKWFMPVVIGITLTGESASADAGISQVRERLLGSGHYTIKSDGPDAGRRFTLDLLTGHLRPPQAPAEGAP